MCCVAVLIKMFLLSKQLRELLIMFVLLSKLHLIMCIIPDEVDLRKHKRQNSYI